MTVTMLAVLLATVVVAALSLRFAADSRPGISDPPQRWFGRR
jgi:hypothetical protein